MNSRAHAHIAAPLGSARASRAVSGASPETSGTYYSKRALPHFERAWGKYAVAFATHARQNLTSKERDIVFHSALLGHERGQYELYVACVMPDHVHLLFEPQPKDIGAEGQIVFWSLPEILQGIKSSTAHRINKERGVTGKVWEKESFDRLIRSETDLREKFAYICRNPWDSHVVGQTEEYPWLWTPDMSWARAPKAAREGACAPRTE
jgi:putative transposase